MGLEVRDVEHSFGDLTALDGVTFDVAPGVLTGLLGPNGAGKTTLMRILLGVLSPERGVVLLDGRPVGEEDRRRWGYMPQERGLYPAMPAGDQVAYFGRLHGLSRGDARRARRRCSTSSGWPTGRAIAPTSSPAACSSGSSWRPRSSTTRR